MGIEYSLLRHIDKVVTPNNDSSKNTDNLTFRELVDLVRGYKTVRDEKGEPKIVVVSTSK